MTPATRKLLFGLLALLALLLVLYGGARLVTGMVLEWRITERLADLGYSSDHQVDIRVYQRGVLSSKLNLVVDSPAMQGVVHARVIHGPLFKSGELTLAELIVDLPARTYLSALSGALPAPLHNLMPDVGLDGASVFPRARISALLQPDDTARGSIKLADFDYAGERGERLGWSGFNAQFSHLPGSGPLFFQADLGRFVSADRFGRLLDVDSATLDGEFSAPLDPRSASVVSLFLGETALAGTARSRVALDALELQAAVRPETDWLREFDLAIPGARYEPRFGEAIDFDVSGNLQFSNLDAVEWDRFKDDLYRGTDSLVWSELAESDATVRISRLNFGVDRRRGESFGVIRLKPLQGEDIDPWAAVEGKLFLEFNRDVLDVLVAWELAPYFSAAVARGREENPDASVEDVVEQEIAGLVQSGWLKTRSGNGFATVISIDPRGMLINGRPITPGG